MKIQNKLAGHMFLFGVFILLISSITNYFLSQRLALDNAHGMSRHSAEKTARYIEGILKEKAKTGATLASAPVVPRSLNDSNTRHAALDESERQEHIARLNNQWQMAKESSDPFIQRYLANPLALYLKAQQALLPGEYGELFSKCKKEIN